MTAQTLDDDAIRETAYLFWLGEGQPAGRDQDHWLRAIDALTPAKRKPVAKKAAKKLPRPKRLARPKRPSQAPNCVIVGGGGWRTISAPAPTGK
jgi:hypothetical protein